MENSIGNEEGAENVYWIVQMCHEHDDSEEDWGDDKKIPQECILPENKSK